MAEDKGKKNNDGPKKSDEGKDDILEDRDLGKLDKFGGDDENSGSDD